MTTLASEAVAEGAFGRDGSGLRCGSFVRLGFGAGAGPAGGDSLARANGRDSSTPGIF